MVPDWIPKFSLMRQGAIHGLFQKLPERACFNGPAWEIVPASKKGFIFPIIGQVHGKVVHTVFSLMAALH